MKEYLANLQKLAESNPQLAKEMANKAFREQGLVDAGIIDDADVKEPIINAGELTDTVQRAVKKSSESDVPNIPSAYVDDNGTLQHIDQPKKLVKK